MKIAISKNPASVGSLMAGELIRRGHSVHVYAHPLPVADTSHVTPISAPGSGLAYNLLVKGRARLKMVLNHYELEINNVAGHSKSLVKATKTVPCYHDMHIDLYNGNRGRGFVMTPNLMEIVERGSELLPRPVNLEMFNLENASRLRKSDGNAINIGHFWRRGNVQADLANRYLKGTDFVDEAISMIGREGYRVNYIQDLVLRKEIPRVLANLDVLVEQVVVGSYGIPAIEALLLGIPVVGYYTRELSECPEVFESAIIVERKNALSIYKGIKQALEKKVSGTRIIAEYHSPKHAVDIFLDKASQWDLI